VTDAPPTTPPSTPPTDGGPAGTRAGAGSPAAKSTPAPDAVLRIALTRHGQTDWNAEGRFQGSSDVPLNATGRAQALESVGLFGEGEWDAVVTSPLSRAAETGAVIAAGLGIPVRGAYPGLVERHYGEAEGERETDAAERWPGGDYPGLEPRPAVAERGFAALESIADDLPGAAVVVVAHGTLIRELLRRMTETPVPPIANAATSIVERSASGWRVVTINDRELSAS